MTNPPFGACVSNCNCSWDSSGAEQGKSQTCPAFPMVEHKYKCDKNKKGFALAAAS